MRIVGFYKYDIIAQHNLIEANEQEELLQRRMDLIRHSIQNGLVRCVFWTLLLSINQYCKYRELSLGLP